MVTHSISVPLAPTSVTTTTDQEINTIGTQTTKPALQSQMPNLNITIAKPTPITMHHSTTIEADTEGIKSGTINYVQCMLIKIKCSGYCMR